MLVKSVSSLGNNDILAFSVSVSTDVHGSPVLDVDDGTIVILEKLEPSSICVPDLKVR